MAGGESVVVIGAAGSGSRRSPSPAAVGARVCAVDVSAASLDRALFNGADEVVDASIGADKRRRGRDRGGRAGARP